jgi:hypothetical protein
LSWPSKTKPSKIELEQIAEQHVELKAEFDKKFEEQEVARSSRAMTWRQAC